MTTGKTQELINSVDYLSKMLEEKLGKLIKLKEEEIKLIKNENSKI